jgi:hypothetical protein
MTPAANTPGGSAQTYAPGSARPLSGDWLRHRATHEPSLLHVSALRVGIAIAGAAL